MWQHGYFCADGGAAGFAAEGISKQCFTQRLPGLAHGWCCPQPLPQVLLSAKSKLEAVVDERFDDAVAKRDAASATRFARLYKPLGKQVCVVLCACACVYVCVCLRACVRVCVCMCA